MDKITRIKYPDFSLIMFITFLVIVIGQNNYSQQLHIDTIQTQYKSTLDSLKKIIHKQNDIISKIKIKKDRQRKSYRIVDTLCGIKNFPLKMIDKSLAISLPKIILDTLRKSYKDYYIPNYTRCSASGRGNIKISEKPFSISGDFNNDGIIDYAFIMESYSLNFYHEWSQEVRTIIFSSIETDKFQIFEFGGSSGVGRMYKIERALIKLEKDENYSIYDKTIEFQSDKILMISWGNDVGVILDWDGKEYKRRELWDVL